MQSTKFGSKISVMEITRRTTQGRSDRKCRMERLRIAFEIISMIKDIEIQTLGGGGGELYKFCVRNSHLPWWLRPHNCIWGTQGRQCTYNWGAFVQPLLQWNINKYYILWVCVCSPRYPACNAHAPYCHLWSAPLYTIFPHYLIKVTI